MLASPGASSSNDFFITTIQCQAVIMIPITLRSPGDVRHGRATELRPCFKYVSATLRLEL